MSVTAAALPGRHPYPAVTPKRQFTSLPELAQDVGQSPSIIVPLIGWISRGESIVSG